MIEVVRACMRAGKLAETATFFSFGTNDLTQATFSFSREDAENKFLPFYNEHKILQDNPFEILDVKGVGRLMAIAVEWGRKTRAGPKSWHLRRTRRRTLISGVLSPNKPGLCQLLTVSGACGKISGCAGEHQREERHLKTLQVRVFLL